MQKQKQSKGYPLAKLIPKKQLLSPEAEDAYQKAIVKLADDIENQLSEPNTKVIPIDRNKMVKVRRVQYSKEQTEAVFHCISHIIALRDAQYKLKGTEFYSASLEREMDKISSTKLMPIFKQNSNDYISETSMKMADVFSQMCDFSFQLSLQPEKVQDRFEKEYKNLLISCGITIK